MLPSLISMKKARFPECNLSVNKYSKECKKVNTKIKEIILIEGQAVILTQTFLVLFSFISSFSHNALIHIIMKINISQYPAFKIICFLSKQFYHNTNFMHIEYISKAYITQMKTLF